MRAYAAAHLPHDEVIPIGWPDASAALQSEYTGGEDGKAYAVTVHGQIWGEADSLEDAQRDLGKRIATLLPLFAVASNAAVAEPLMVAAYGLDPRSRQPFLGYETPSAGDWFPPGARTISSASVGAFMRAVAMHPETGYLHRALEFYRQALVHWIPEERLLAGEFLFISAETLSRALLEMRAADRGVSPKGLARLEGLSGPERLRSQILDEVFGNDSEARRAMQRASDGFEHGFMALDEVSGLLEGVVERSMRHVRTALVRATGVDEEVAAALLSERYSSPRGLVPTARVVIGDLTPTRPEGSDPQGDPAAIELVWRPWRVQAARKGNAGKTTLAFHPWVITPTRIPEELVLRVTGYAFRAAHVLQTPIEEPGPPPPPKGTE